MDMLPAARLLSDPSGNFPDASTSPPCPLTNCNCCAHTVMEPLPGNVIANVDGAQLQVIDSTSRQQWVLNEVYKYGQCKWEGSAYNTGFARAMYKVLARPLTILASVSSWPSSKGLVLSTAPPIVHILNNQRLTCKWLPFCEPIGQERPTAQTFLLAKRI